MFDGFKIMRKDQARRLKYQEEQNLHDKDKKLFKQAKGQVKSFVSKLVK